MEFRNMNLNIENKLTIILIHNIFIPSLFCLLDEPAFCKSILKPKLM